MNARKVLGSIQTAALLLSASLSITSISLNTPTSIPTNDYRFTADGGAPVPPYPQPPVANSSTTFIADGGAPVPPYPQPPVANSSNILITDAGAVHL